MITIEKYMAEEIGGWGKCPRGMRNFPTRPVPINLCRVPLGEYFFSETMPEILGIRAIASGDRMDIACCAGHLRDIPTPVKAEWFLHLVTLAVTASLARVGDRCPEWSAWADAWLANQVDDHATWGEMARAVEPWVELERARAAEAKAVWRAAKRAALAEWLVARKAKCGIAGSPQSKALDAVAEAARWAEHHARADFAAALQAESFADALRLAEAKGEVDWALRWRRAIDLERTECRAVGGRYYVVAPVGEDICRALARRLEEAVHDLWDLTILMD